MLYTVHYTQSGHSPIPSYYFYYIIASKSLLKIEIIRKYINLYMKTAQKGLNCILALPTELEIASLYRPKYNIMQLEVALWGVLESLWGKILIQQEWQRATGSVRASLNSWFLSWSEENEFGLSVQLWENTEVFGTFRQMNEELLRKE